LFSIDFNRAPIERDAARRQPLDHPAGLRRVSRLKITVAQAGPLSADLLAAAQHCPQVEFAVGPRPLMEVCFDDEAQGRHHEFVLLVPLVFSW
jgi:hypothetical protein